MAVDRIAHLSSDALVIFYITHRDSVPYEICAI